MPAPPIGLLVTRPTPSATLALIVRAEQHGVPSAWSTVAGITPAAPAHPAVDLGAARGRLPPGRRDRRRRHLLDVPALLPRPDGAARATLGGRGCGAPRPSADRPCAGGHADRSRRGPRGGTPAAGDVWPLALLRPHVRRRRVSDRDGWHNAGCALRRAGRLRATGAGRGAAGCDPGC